MSQTSRGFAEQERGIESGERTGGDGSGAGGKWEPLKIEN